MTDLVDLYEAMGFKVEGEGPQRHARITADAKPQYFTIQLEAVVSDLTMEDGLTVVTLNLRTEHGWYVASLGSHTDIRTREFENTIELPIEQIHLVKQPSITFVNNPIQAEKVFDNRPHSRACGIRNHEHGTDCHSNCPTCHGKAHGWE